MQNGEYPYLIDVQTLPDPIYIHLLDINSVDSFFVFMDAAIRCHPFVLVGSFALTFFLFYIIINSKEIYHRILCSYSNHIIFQNKGGE